VPLEDAVGGLGARACAVQRGRHRGAPATERSGLEVLALADRDGRDREGVRAHRQLRQRFTPPGYDARAATVAANVARGALGWRTPDGFARSEASTDVAGTGAQRFPHGERERAGEG